VAPAHNEELRAKLKEAFEAKISEAYTIAVKQDRYAALDAIHAEAVAQFVPEEVVDGIADEVDYLFEDLNYRTVRDKMLCGIARIVGR
ncbi:polyribonucleotide nucleotidyltransferase, partial [Acinetobacter baumannii]